MKAKSMLCLVGAGVLATVLFSSSAFSKPEFAKKEGKPCTSCHVKAGDKELNDTGKCYKASNADEARRSLEKCGAK